MSEQIVIGILITALYFVIGMIIGKLSELDDDKLIWFAIIWPIPVAVLLLFGVFAIFIITYDLIKTLYMTIVKGEKLWNT